MRTKVPYQSDEEIWQAVETFRISKDCQAYVFPPVDSLSLAEIVLHLDAILFDNLFAKYSVDAALLFDLTGIYIDKQAYMDWDNNDKWEEKRLRFSIAHEIGHVILHRDEILNSNFVSVKEFKKWAGKRDDCNSAEYQAQEFAGRLLVPKRKLIEIYDYYCKKAKVANPQWRELKGMRERLARKIAPRFGVTYKVIETRFDHEGIWPVE